MASYPQGPPGAGEDAAGFVATSPARGPRRGSFFSATGLSIGAAAILAFLLFLKGAPAIAYWAHLPIAFFYIVFIGGLVISYLVRRRWKRLLPRQEPAVAVYRMDLGRLAFRVVPTFAIVGFAAWVAIINHGPKYWMYVAAGFAVFWSLAWAPLWSGVIRRR